MSCASAKSSEPTGASTSTRAGRSARRRRRSGPAERASGACRSPPTEAWSLAAKPNQDWNHAWGTAPLNVIARHVLGVRPTSPGFRTYAVEPHCGSLEVAGVVPTVRGPIAVGKRDARLTKGSVARR